MRGGIVDDLSAGISQGGRSGQNSVSVMPRCVFLVRPRGPFWLGQSFDFSAINMHSHGDLCELCIWGKIGDLQDTGVSTLLSSLGYPPRPLFLTLFFLLAYLEFSPPSAATDNSNYGVATTKVMSQLRRRRREIRRLRLGRGAANRPRSAGL